MLPFALQEGFALCKTHNFLFFQRVNSERIDFVQASFCMDSLHRVRNGNILPAVLSDIGSV